jgi:hypothetical protein
MHTFPIDYRIYDRNTDDLTTNDHFRDMLQAAADRGFTPYFVMFDSWSSSFENLKIPSPHGMELAHPSQEE